MERGKRKQQRGSVRKATEKKKFEVEIVFGSSDSADQSPATAKATGSNDKTGKRDKKRDRRRLLFRF